jgi:hypothetical protein
VVCLLVMELVLLLESGLFTSSHIRKTFHFHDWRAPKSRGETHLKVPQSQVTKSWNLEARSWLPTLERGRGSSWEPRD